MIEIFPRPYNHFSCPRCISASPLIHKIIFQGIHLLADLECTQCGFAFFQDFPVGHGLTYSAVIDKKHLQVMSPNNMDWYTKPLVNSLQHPSPENVAVSKITNKETEDSDTVIFFNCMDAWYGHVVLKLMNIQFYHDQYPSYKKIVLVPEGFTWMVPDYANEIWTASVKLRETINYFLQLESFILEELKEYKTVYHSTGYSHPPLQQIRALDFFRSPAFDLKCFLSAPPKILFVYREDRLWIHPFLNRLFNFLNYKKIKFANPFFYTLQVKKINGLAKKIKSYLPHSSFSVCGIGKYGRLSSGINDERSVVLSSQQELAWCRLYSETHIVIGIHGSNMLIPSALAASWIEILSDDRIGNISQDLFCKYSFNQMVFLGRFASLHDPVKRIAEIARSMIVDYESFSNHQVINYSLNK